MSGNRASVLVLISPPMPPKNKEKRGGGGKVDDTIADEDLPPLISPPLLKKSHSHQQKSCKTSEGEIKIEGAIRILYKNGDRYQGSLNQRGHKTGLGSYFWNSGDKFFGYFENNNMTGGGLLLYANGDTYKGRWKLNKINGTGVRSVINDGTITEGYFVGAQARGYIRKTFTFVGDIFEGYVEEDTREGFGRYHWKEEGAEYIG